MISEKLPKLYHYLADTILEMTVAYRLLKDYEAIIEGEPEQEKLTFLSSVYLDPENQNKISEHFSPIILRMAINTLIIGICRVSESLSANGYGKILKEATPKFQSELKKFSSRYYTQPIRDYRNKYAAHPVDNKSKDFLSREELTALLSEALNSIAFYENTDKCKEASKKTEYESMTNRELEITMRTLLEVEEKGLSDEECGELWDKNMERENSKFSTYFSSIFEDYNKTKHLSIGSIHGLLQKELIDKNIDFSRK